MLRNNAAVFIVIPVYNEEKTIGQVVRELQAQLFQNLIVVDDGSTDTLFDAVKDMPVHYLKHAVNLGQGAALQTGFCYALQQGAAVVVTFDADGQHDAADLDKLIRPILDGKADVVLGSRFLSGERQPVPAARKCMLQVARLVNFFISGLWFTDAHNGLRAFSSAALQQITLEHNRMSHATEVLVKMRKARLRFLEVPVAIRYTAYAMKKGQKSRDGIAILFDLLLYKLFK